MPRGAKVPPMLGGSPLRSCRRAFALVLVLACCAGTSSVSASDDRPGSAAIEAQGFSPEEITRLQDGKSVKRAFFIGEGDGTYHAGYSYRLVQAPPMEVIRVLRRPGGLIKAIPYGLSATTLSEEDGVTRMRIAQGKRPIVGRYTVRLEWDLSDYSARFWLDPTEDHDLNDVWGVFSAREVAPGVTLVSFGFAFDIGGVGSVLEHKAQTWGLTTADRIAELLGGS